MELRYKQSERGGSAATKLGDADRFRRIRCPLCKWQPKRSDRWRCRCGHSWNTFETSGVCPACAHAWRETQCLRCHEWSPHEQWYADDE